MHSALSAAVWRGHPCYPGITEKGCDTQSSLVTRLRFSGTKNEIWEPREQAHRQDIVLPLGVFFFSKFSKHTWDDLIMFHIWRRNSAPGLSAPHVSSWYAACNTVCWNSGVAPASPYILLCKYLWKGEYIFTFYNKLFPFVYKIVMYSVFHDKKWKFK